MLFTRKPRHDFTRAFHAEPQFYANDQMDEVIGGFVCGTKVNYAMPMKPSAVIAGEPVQTWKIDLVLTDSGTSLGIIDYFRFLDAVQKTVACRIRKDEIYFEALNDDQMEAIFHQCQED